jgi:hypothetical protein
MKVIYKFKLETAYNKLSMPLGSKILSIDLQQNKFTLWALCDPEAVCEDVFITLIPTGKVMEDSFFESSEFIGTVFLEHLVFHAFKVPNNNNHYYYDDYDH